MIEKMTFDMSGLVRDKNDKDEIEFWGHDAGEFVLEEVVEVLEREGLVSVGSRMRDGQNREDDTI